MNLRLTLIALLCCATLPALEYAHKPADPQPTGWPLTAEEKAFIGKPEYDRRPGRENNQHLPNLWPAVPSAGSWGGTSWVDTHAKLVTYVQANQGPCDVLLVGDSITQQWGSPLDKGVLNVAWLKAFPNAKTINIGIGGDKAQNVLWRLDHGGVDGIKPRAIVLMIGNNNMFFTPETGVAAAAQGVKACLANLREKFPEADVVVAKILPCHAPKVRFYEDILLTNAEIDKLNLGADPKVKVLDLTKDYLNADGTIKPALFVPDNIHLSLAGYEVYAARLKPLLDPTLGGKGLGSSVVLPKKETAPKTESAPDTKPAKTEGPTPKSADGKSLLYPYAPYNEGKLDPQLTGWPLTEAEIAWANKDEYTRKPGHEIKKHLPEMWFVTPTAGRWRGKDATYGNVWLAHHAKNIANVKAAGAIDVVLIGDSITQGWGGGFDETPFNAAWQKHFSGLKAVNLGIGGDRMEHILWRLDHGALDGASPKVIVLKIGVNNAPLIKANGVPVSAAAQGIKLCVENLRLRCPQSQIIVVKILPAFDPSKDVGATVREVNVALDTLKLDADPLVHVIDVGADFTHADGSLKSELYSDKYLHLNLAGYEVFAIRLKPLLEATLKR
jgi:platelet-activating factor acetylhydrolase IB subunit beta/gamma